MCPEEVQFVLVASTTLGHHIVLAPSTFASKPLLHTNYTLFGIVAKVNQPGQIIILHRAYTTTLYGCWGGQICNLGWAPAPHWATISCVALSTSLSTGASDQLYFVWDSSKGKSTGSDRILAHKPYYELICSLRRSNLGWSPASHWATISYVALSTCSSTGASEQLYFVWDSSKGKSTGSDHLLAHKRYYNLLCVLRRSNLGWSPAPH